MNEREEFLLRARELELREREIRARELEAIAKAKQVESNHSLGNLASVFGAILLWNFLSD